MLKTPTRFKIRVNADNIERVLDILRWNGYKWISGRRLELRGDYQYTTIGLLIDHHTVARFADTGNYLASSLNEMPISQLLASDKPADVSGNILSLF